MKTWKLSPSAKHRNHLALVGPHDDDFVAALYDRLPRGSHRWVPAAKVRLVHRDHEEIVREIISEHSEVEGPSDLIGASVCAEDGERLGSLTGVGMGRDGVVVTMDSDPSPSLLDIVGTIGEESDSAEALEALELIGDPRSVTVRKVGTARVILAVVECSASEDGDQLECLLEMIARGHR